MNVSRRSVLALAAGAALASAAAAACRKPAGPAPTDEEIGPLVAPAALSARLAEVKAGTLHVLHVGPKTLFDRGRIPGARHVGEASEKAGYDAMIAALRALPPDAEVILYCGCCPYKPCPNVRPASRALAELKLAKGAILDLPTNLRTDWIERGYALET